MADSDNTRAIDEFLSANIPKGEGDIITGWVVAYEIVNDTNGRASGFIYEYNNMTAWRAVGLLEWAKMAILSRIWIPDV